MYISRRIRRRRAARSRPGHDMTSHARILVVDDDALVRRALTERLRADGYDIFEAANGIGAIERACEGFDLVLIDYDLTDVTAATVLRRIWERDPHSPAILLIPQASAVTADEARQIGGYRLAKQPLDADDLSMMVSQVLETARLRTELRTLRGRQAQPYSFDRIVGGSPQMIALRQQLREAAANASPVLLTGEDGTGKDLAARVLHFNSDRAMRPFIAVACAAERRLEIELFGAEHGEASNGRHRNRGLLEAADGGTILLDDISEMAPALQAKLLRLLETRTFRRIGGSRDIGANVRVLAATTRKLETQVKAGHFREDLYLRLNVFPVDLPPLRMHPDDLPSFITFYVDAYNRKFRKMVRGASLPALRALREYGWPGNVREVRNAVERAMLRTASAWLEPQDFPVLGTNVQAANGIALPTEGINLEELERSLVVQALERAAGNQTRAAALLGLNRDQIRYRIGKFGLSRAAVPVHAAADVGRGRKIAAASGKIPN
jgi:two-component system, NtrC family, response regulator AtoC